MKQQIISEGKEALERALLLMKYDSKKTLTENLESTKQPINEIAPLLGFIPMALPWLIGYGVTAAAGISAWIYNTQGGGDSFSKTKTFFKGCKTNIKELKPTVSKSEYRAAADAIYGAIEGFGTTLQTIKTSLSSMPTVADLCALNSWYSTQYGDLYEDLDSDIDGTDFTKYVWSAIAPTIADAEDDLEKAKDGKKDGGVTDKDGKKDGGSLAANTMGYKLCTGKYVKGCKSPRIKELQNCLGTSYTGKNDIYFGDLTQAALKANGYESGVTDADIDKICQKESPVADSSTDDINEL